MNCLQYTNQNVQRVLPVPAASFGDLDKKNRWGLTLLLAEAGGSLATLFVCVSAL